MLSKAVKMIFPMPHLHSGPPSSFALKVRPYFMALLFVQLLLCLGRFMILDFWGATILVLVTLVGSLSMTSECGVDLTYCAYYGIMAFICGVFDILLVVERASRSPYPIFHPTKAPLMYNVASAIYVLCPLVELASAYVSYLLFKDADDWEARTTLPNPFGGVYRADYGATAGPVAGANSDRGNTASEELPPNAPRRPAPPAFTPFQGSSHRLEA